MVSSSHRVFAAFLLLIVCFSGAGSADELKLSQDFFPLTADKPYVHVVHEGQSIKVQRVQDPDYQLRGYFAKTVRKCPPFCLQPISPAPGIAAIGEVELFEFLERDLRDGSGLLIDARTPSWYSKGTIPGSVNIPFSQLSRPMDDPEMVALLQRFGGVERAEGAGVMEKLLRDWGWHDDPNLTEDWDFSKALKLVLWCNGPECGQSPRAIRGLLAAGYPKDKILYYRGGMQMWQLWGLTTVVPEK